jgi:hypothetical protein
MPLDAINDHVVRCFESWKTPWIKKLGDDVSEEQEHEQDIKSQRVRITYGLRPGSRT